MKLGPGKRKQDQGKQQYDENHKKEEIVLDNKKVWKYLTTLAKQSTREHTERVIK